MKRSITIFAAVILLAIQTPVTAQVAIPRTTDAPARPASTRTASTRTGLDVIHFRDEAQVVDHVVRLGDLATIRLADRQREAELKELVLYSAPVPGGTRNIRTRQVQDELQLRDISLERIQLTGASKIRVSRVAAVGRTLAVDSQMRVDREEAPERPDGNLIAVAKRRLRQGERLIADDIRWVDADKFQLRNFAPIREEQRLVGRQLSRTVNENTPIHRDWIVEPVLVRRNSIVSVAVVVGGIRVRTTARSQRDGGIHDIITLESLEDRKTTFAGRVVGIDQVEIIAQSSTVGPRPVPPTPPEARYPKPRQNVASPRTLSPRR